ncbi:MAG: 1,4-dihydroxy-2-naphthoyl-CoA hydrolase in phylloquinone biosynthesis [Cyanobacteriota bacterium]|jgi:1,4-dihydroxy-2-naphthoyl-CoA hydrolase
MVTYKHWRSIYLADTDAAGVVYFNRLLQICHETYEAWLTAQKLSLQALIQQGQWGIPVIHAEIDFLAPTYCGDRLEIHLQIQQVSDHRFICDYQLHRQAPSPPAMVARAQTQHLCINLSSRQKSALPPPWQSALIGILAEQSLP